MQDRIKTQHRLCYNRLLWQPQQGTNTAKVQVGLIFSHHQVTYSFMTHLFSSMETWKLLLFWTFKFPSSGGIAPVRKVLHSKNCTSEKSATFTFLWIIFVVELLGSFSELPLSVDKFGKMPPLSFLTVACNSPYSLSPTWGCFFPRPYNCFLSAAAMTYFY